MAKVQQKQGNCQQENDTKRQVIRRGGGKTCRRAKEVYGQHSEKEEGLETFVQNIRRASPEEQQNPLANKQRKRTGQQQQQALGTDVGVDNIG